jgi:hypothetical protein
MDDTSGLNIIEALGLAPDRVGQVTIHLSPGRPTTVTVEHFTMRDNRLAIEIGRYHLVPMARG